MTAHAMTGRERLRAILRKQPVDRLCWTTLVDTNTLSLLPAELQGNGGIDFYRHLGCDVFLLNGWGLPHELRSPELRWGAGVTTGWRQEGARAFQEWKTPRGNLTAEYDRGHPVKYPVVSPEDVRLYRWMWEQARYVGHDDRPALDALDRIIGPDGVVTRFWGPSTIPRLLENDIGMENFYYLMADCPDDMESLIRVMHEQERDAFRLLAEGPWESVTLVENTSTYYISPDIYRRFNMPHQREFVEQMKAKGKTAILHMCGHVRTILDIIRETGCDGIHTLTPPPTGNTPWEAALDHLGEHTILFGCLDPSVFVSGPPADIPRTLDRLITPRLRASPFVLCPMADGIPVPRERFEIIARWMRENA